MAAVLRNGRIETDNWRLPESSGAPVGAGESVMVTLTEWRARRAEFVAHGGPLGVLLEPADPPEELQGDFARLELIAVRFPHFTDGRGYSVGRLLRERFGWTGELRAVGDVQRDQLFFLRRCGFDAYSLRPGEDAAAAAAALQGFSESYQTGVDRVLPLFRRRAA